MSEPSYYQQRLQLLGITEEINKIALWKSDTVENKNVLKEEPIFRKHEKGIEIIVYTLERLTVRVEKDGSRYKKDWSIIRLEHPIQKSNGETIKYLMPKGQGSYPFFPPALIDKYDARKAIDILYITEGFFKAMKGSMAGLDIIGIPSITHLRAKETGALHPDIIELIKKCGVKRVVWLTDGDALDLSSKAFDSKEKIDLYKRPAQFFASISTFKQLLDDYDCDKYWMHVNSDEIYSTQNFMKDLTDRVSREEVKGLDDILIKFPEATQEIVDDIASVSKPGFWFVKFNITVGLSKVKDYFRLNNVNTFYLFHAERRPELKGKEFIFLGTRYRYDDEKGECEILIPGDATNYFRVGDDYYKFVKIPNKHNQLERTFKGRRKSTITDDHGKLFPKHIPKYEAFCNVPSHVNFQQVSNNCFNTYNPMDYEPLEEECTSEDCPTILALINHIFGNNIIHFTHPNTKAKSDISTIDLALDYFQILYQRPTEKLPILCLVSKENNTGKTTLGNFIKAMFGANAAIVGNADLAGDFNAHWSTKLVVICDETKIDKQVVVEKIKSLSTGDRITVNAKGRDQTEIDCFIKFILITNNEENFINIKEEDTRYWVIKVPIIKQENTAILSMMIDEIPAFMSFLNRRKLVTEKLNRMWFHPSLLKTEALKKVIVNNVSTLQKELVERLRDMFFDFGVQEIYLTRQEIYDEFFRKKYELNYLKYVIEDNLHVERYHDFVVDGKSYKTIDSATIAVRQKYNVQAELEIWRHITRNYTTCRHSYPRWEFDAVKKEPIRVDVQRNGRPYVFKREQFLSKEEIATVVITDENKFLNEQTVQPGEAITAESDELPF